MCSMFNAYMWHHICFLLVICKLRQMATKWAFTGDDDLDPCEEEIRKQAQEQKNQENWAEAITLYEKIYSPHCDRWLAWEYSDCLKKFSRLDEAISVSKNLYQRDKQFIHNNNFLSWLLYEKYFKHPKTEYSVQELNHLYEIATSITTFTTQDGKGAYEITIIQMLKLLKKYGNNPVAKIIALIDKLDAQKLSDKAGTYEQNGREKEYQSPKEMFYAMKTKALLDSKFYPECISCCDEALLCLNQFHHDNKSWIIARKAVSMAQSGIQKLHGILKCCKPFIGSPWKPINLLFAFIPCFVYPWNISCFYSIKLLGHTSASLTQ